MAMYDGVIDRRTASRIEHRNETPIARNKYSKSKFIALKIP
jgi:hypothetical protein